MKQILMSCFYVVFYRTMITIEYNMERYTKFCSKEIRIINEVVHIYIGISHSKSHCEKGRTVFQIILVKKYRNAKGLSK